MALQTSGPITIGQIAAEFKCSKNLKSCAQAAKISTSNIAMSKFYGLSGENPATFKTIQIGGIEDPVGKYGYNQTDGFATKPLPGIYITGEIIYDPFGPVPPDPIITLNDWKLVGVIWDKWVFNYASGLDDNGPHTFTAFIDGDKRNFGITKARITTTNGATLWEHTFQSGQIRYNYKDTGVTEFMMGLPDPCPITPGTYKIYLE